MSEEKVPGGYNGRVLRINLSDRSTTAEAIGDRFCRQYIGGAGFIAHYLWKELKQGVDPLGPENKLIFALGPVSGQPLAGGARNCVGAKSPLTGGVAMSEAGGFWAAELKRAGYDAIIVEGRADTPVYLSIRDGEASIRDATHLWGHNTKETEAEIRAELGDSRVQLALIGPAGENVVRYACIMHGLHDAAGRGGLGAVMGSKNLKAIAVRGHNLPHAAEPDRLKEIRQRLVADPHPISFFGTGGPDMLRSESVGNLPVRNFRDGLFPGVRDINGVVIKETIRVGMEGCFACPIRCKKVVQFDEPYRVEAAYGGPEYETLAGLGSNCGVGNLKAIARGNALCNAYSLDTISTGNVIAFAMECFEKGLLNTGDTSGIELRFGNDEAMLECIELIARRQGIGDLLAKGTARLARKIGGGSDEFAIQVKGLESAMHDPRVKPGMGVGYMVNPHGADHCCNIIEEFYLREMDMIELHPLGLFDPLPMSEIGPRKVALFRLLQLKAIVQDSMVVCHFPPFTYQTMAELMAAVTGWDTGIIELLRVGERVLTLARLFNLREGFSVADDVLPDRFFQPKTDGVLADTRLDRAEMEKARNYYYALMGWDEKGVPLPEKVEELYIT